MGMGLCCPSGMPVDQEQQVVMNTREMNASEREETQKLYNRHSAQVYVGERKRKIESDDNKPPDNVNDANKTSSDTVLIANNEANGKVGNGTGGKEMTSSVSSENDADGESKDSVPDFLDESFLSSIHKFHPPPVIAPFDPNTCEVKRRPRSLDSASDGQVKRKSRPLSYSPGLLKTKHPRSLHSIHETPPPTVKQRPQSMDMSAFFEAKGFDIHTQKLRRVLTQKVKEKILQDMENNKCTLQPGQVKYLEEGPSRCFQPSQMAARKKKNKDLKVKEINYLKKAITKPRMKFSKSVDIFFQNVDQYRMYDPMLDPLAAQPNNPWMTDDETMWEINKSLVEVPTVMRIKKWAVSFEDLLHDQTGLIEFEHFLKKEYSVENMIFYKTCKEIIVCPNAKVGLLRSKIEKEFLQPGAPYEVNVDCKTLEQVTAQLKADDSAAKARYIFQPVMEHVYSLMKKDSYTRFIRSDQYKHLLEKAQTHYTKKKFFNFGSNRKKTPSPLVKRRGSASSDGVLDGDMGGGSYHSYSTGNLQELDEKPKRALRALTSTPGFVENSHVGSDSSIYMGTYSGDDGIYMGTHDGQTASPSLRRKTENMEANSRLTGSQDPRRRSNLEVPRSSYSGSVVPEANRKSENMSQCLALNVPRTNVVAPWSGSSE